MKLSWVCDWCMCVACSWLESGFIILSEQYILERVNRWRIFFSYVSIKSLQSSEWSFVLNGKEYKILKTNALLPLPINSKLEQSIVCLESVIEECTFSKTMFNSKEYKEVKKIYQVSVSVCVFDCMYWLFFNHKKLLIIIEMKFDIECPSP